MHKKFCTRIVSCSDNPKSTIQKQPRRRKWAGIFVLAFTFTFTGVAARAQQPAKIRRIGYLTGATPGGQSARLEAFRRGLRELGYAEGKNSIIEYRYAEGHFDRLPALAAELVRLKVEVIVTGGGGLTRAAKDATN
jgi:putative ABC transport system substrate-binding protein